MLTTTTTLIEGRPLVTMTYDGTFDVSELDTARQELTRAAEGTKGVRVLLDIKDVDLTGLQADAVWEDLKSARLLGDVDRLAVLTDSSIIRGLVSASAISPLDAEVYTHDRREDALVWLSE